MCKKPLICEDIHTHTGPNLNYSESKSKPQQNLKLNKLVHPKVQNRCGKMKTIESFLKQSGENTVLRKTETRLQPDFTSN